MKNKMRYRGGKKNCFLKNKKLLKEAAFKIKKRGLKECSSENAVKMHDKHVFETFFYEGGKRYLKKALKIMKKSKKLWCNTLEFRSFVVATAIFGNLSVAFCKNIGSQIL